MSNSIMAFWDDLITRDFSDQSILYKTIGTPGSQEFIMQWTNMYFYSNPSLPMGTFQAILYEGTNKVQLQYRDLLGGDASMGNSATVGINKDGTTANQVSYNSASLTEGQAISFTPDGGGGYTVNTSATYDPVYLADASAPDAPILSAPTNSTTDVSTTPTFSWGAANLADTYQLVVASDANYSNIVINESGLTNTTYTPSTALDTNTMYYWKVIAVNSSGTAISDGWKFTTAPPDDNDGVLQSVEAAAPNGGDANGDSTPDSQQTNVTSLVDPVTNRYAVLDTVGCPTNTNVSAAAHTNDDSYTYPAGMLSFVLDCASPGDTATITQYYYGVDPSGLVLRKYNSTTHTYQNITNATISSVLIGGQAATKVVYTVTDGSALDDDGTVDGHIVDPVGLAEAVAPGAPNTGVGSREDYLAGLLALTSISLFITAGALTLSRKKSQF
ncbi:MAG: hypothetical protein H6797_04345 [Candidatus Nomurabacteria bacterium]|nr:MAG: hypothetical protein H6797_04345 [Candidatus Nomurabacteria bacterium]